MVGEVDRGGGWRQRGWCKRKRMVGGEKKARRSKAWQGGREKGITYGHGGGARGA